MIIETDNLTDKEIIDLAITLDVKGAKSREKARLAEEKQRKHNEVYLFKNLIKIARMRKNHTGKRKIAIALDLPYSAVHNALQDINQRKHDRSLAKHAALWDENKRLAKVKQDAYVNAEINEINQHPVLGKTVKRSYKDETGNYILYQCQTMDGEAWITFTIPAETSYRTDDNGWWDRLVIDQKRDAEASIKSSKSERIR